MKIIISLCFISIMVTSCESWAETKDPHHENFENRTINLSAIDSLEYGKTYLSVYSQIYSFSEHKTHNLTVTASIRNINLKDTIYITNGQYSDTDAKPIHSYFEKPVFVAPLETLEIVIDEVDLTEGIGAHFIFDWKIKSESIAPFFEGIMISTYGAQGLSFTTQGIRIE